MGPDIEEYGLVLSGGGLKGIAHAGVLKFLEEKNIEPTVIAGTSAGSIVGGLYACGKKPDEILELFKSVSVFSWNHITFRKPGFLDANVFEVYLKNLLGDITIGELSKELFITATNIVTGKLKIFNTQTKVSEAILASCAFPGVFTPVEVGGKMYSDGGILNNFPANTIQGRCDYIIGVNVSPIVSTDLSKLKSIKNVAIRAFEIMSTQNAHAQNDLCDWYIEPQKLVNYSIFETNRKKMDEIFEVGYEEAKRTFEKLKEPVE